MMDRQGGVRTKSASDIYIFHLGFCEGICGVGGRDGGSAELHHKDHPSEKSEGVCRLEWSGDTVAEYLP